MRCSTRIVLEIETGAVIERESFEYFGPVAHCCGGPSAQQTAAASSQGALDTALSNAYTSGSAVTTPFYTNLVENGLPYFGAQSAYSTSALANQADQQKAMLASQDAGYGGALPSGFASAQQTALAAQTAQNFDQNQLSLLQQQEQAQMAGAAGLNPLASASAASSGNNSIMQAPLQNNFWGNLVGGLVSGAGQAGSAFLGNPAAFAPAMPSAKKGAYVPKTGVMLVHKGEAILTPKQQKKYLKTKPQLPKPELMPLPRLARTPGRRAAAAIKY